MNDHDRLVLVASIIAAHNRLGSARQSVDAARTLLAEVDRCIIQERPAPAEASSHASGTTPGKPPGSDVSSLDEVEESTTGSDGAHPGQSPGGELPNGRHATSGPVVSIEALTERVVQLELQAASESSALNSISTSCESLFAKVTATAQMLEALKPVPRAKHTGEGAEVDHPPTPKVVAGSIPAPEPSPVSPSAPWRVELRGFDALQVWLFVDASGSGGEQAFAVGGEFDPGEREEAERLAQFLRNAMDRVSRRDTRVAVVEVPRG